MPCRHGEPIVRKLLISSLLLTVASPAAAHDVWLQPKGFQFPAPAVAPFVVFVGHGPARELWAIDVTRVVSLRSAGPDGDQDHRADLQGGKAGTQLRGTLRFQAPGTYVVSVQSSLAESDLPALRFNSYATEEGLTPALKLRAQTRQAGSNGREVYSRRMKALIDVGAVENAQPQVTRPIGLSLEIVPERDPYRLKPAERFPVRVIYEGKPLAGALVKLTNLDFDTRPVEMHRTDPHGRTSFDVPRHGAWLVNVIWTKPIAGNPKADFETTFSSLTFGYSAMPR